MGESRESAGEKERVCKLLQENHAMCQHAARQVEVREALADETSRRWRAHKTRRTQESAQGKRWDRFGARWHTAFLLSPTPLPHFPPSLAPSHPPQPNTAYLFRTCALPLSPSPTAPLYYTLSPCEQRQAPAPSTRDHSLRTMPSIPTSPKAPLAPTACLAPGGAGELLRQPSETCVHVLECKEVRDIQARGVKRELTGATSTGPHRPAMALVCFCTLRILFDEGFALLQIQRLGFQGYLTFVREFVARVRVKTKGANPTSH